MSNGCDCHSIWCALDVALHRMKITAGWICDRHDKVIWGRCDMPR